MHDLCRNFRHQPAGPTVFLLLPSRSINSINGISLCLSVSTLVETVSCSALPTLDLRTGLHVGPPAFIVWAGVGAGKLKQTLSIVINAFDYFNRVGIRVHFDVKGDHAIHILTNNPLTFSTALLFHFCSIYECTLVSPSLSLHAFTSRSSLPAENPQKKRKKHFISSKTHFFFPETT